VEGAGIESFVGRIIQTAKL